MIRTLPRLLLVISACVAPSAWAQVAVDRGAVDQLQPSPATPAGPSQSTTKHTPARNRPPPASNRRATTTKPGARPAKPASSKPAPVAVAPAPPPPVALATPALLPVAPLPAPPIPVRPDAPGNATKIIGGLRITFGQDTADLNPTTEAAIRSVARTIGADPNASMNVYAYAGGPPDDPSIPRRMSLSRALAVRAVLIGEGIASTRIYVRALGASAPPGLPEGPPDRVDLTQVGIAPAGTP